VHPLTTASNLRVHNSPDSQIYLHVVSSSSFTDVIFCCFLTKLWKSSQKSKSQQPPQQQEPHLTMRLFPFILFSVPSIVCQAQAFLVPPRKTEKINKIASFVNRGGKSEAMRASKAVIVSSTLIGQIGDAVISSGILGNSFVCMLLSASGDVLAQIFEQKSKTDFQRKTSIDLQRSARLAAFGFIIAGPLYSTWYPFLDALCRPWSLANYGVWAPAIVKMVMEMIFLEPIFLISFFGFMNFAQGGGTISSLGQKIRSDFLPTYKTSLIVWPPFMLLCFRFVPLSALFMVVNVANAMWDGYLSYEHSRTAGLLLNDDDPVPAFDEPFSPLTIPLLTLETPPI
jgi:protein Mpv17